MDPLDPYIFIYEGCVCVCATYISMEYLLLVKADRRATDRLPCSNIAPCCNHSSLSLSLFPSLPFLIALSALKEGRSVEAWAVYQRRRPREKEKKSK
jgi:hypothetical protein